MAVGGTIGLMMVVILIGKFSQKLRPISYLVIVLIAFLQVIIVLYVMYTMQIPGQ